MRIHLLFIFLTITICSNPQSLRDSLFGGNLKVDTTATIKSSKHIKPADTVIYIDADTSLPAKEKKEKEWKKYWEVNSLLIMPDGKMEKLRGQFKAIISFVVEPDGTPAFIKADCDALIEDLKPRLEKFIERSPKLIPSHKGLVYVRTIRRVLITYTIEKRETTIIFSMLKPTR